MLQQILDSETESLSVPAILETVARLEDIGESFADRIAELERENDALRLQGARTETLLPEEFLQALLSDLRSLETHKGELREQLGQVRAEHDLMRNRVVAALEES